MPSAAVAQFLSRLGVLRKTGANWLAKCPAHADDKPSLSITEGADGRVLMHCHAGCTPDAIIAALGVKPAALFASAEAPTVTAQFFDYLDADGALRYQVCRFPPKEFRQRRPDGLGGWVWKMAGIKRLPYRLPELRNQAMVIIVEGEKDANALWSLGMPATTNCGGAGKWGASETKALVAAGVSRVVILPDHDAPGEKHAEDVAHKVKAAGLAVNIIPLPDLPPHGDVSDWLRAGHTADDLRTLIAAMPYVLPKLAAPIVLPEPSNAQDGPSYHEHYDVGAAEAFRDRYGAIVRYDHQTESWVIWKEHHWEPDADEAIRRLAVKHVRAWQREATDLKSDTVRAATLIFTMKLEKRSAIENFLFEAKSMNPINTDGLGWDLNPWQLGCANGVVDLQSGSVASGQPADMLTEQVGTSYDADATCPRWMQFLEEVFDNDPAIIHYVHLALGYSLTGDMREQCFFLAVGTGSNGKSVFLETLEYVLGTYGHRAPMRVFVSGAEDEKFHFADFRGRRLIFAAETKPGGRMNEHVLKNLTGGESLRVERKYGDPFTIKPQAKIWLGVNHHPKVMDDSYGFWRRVRIIPFTRTFSGSTDDRNLGATLKAEAAGILAWMVRGCLLWQRHGLDAPPGVVLATDAYQQSEDPLTEFFEQCTEVEKEAKTSFPMLYAAYSAWAKGQGFKEKEILSVRAVGLNLQKRPFERSKVYGSTVYKGLKLIKPATDLFHNGN